MQKTPLDLTAIWNPAGLVSLLNLVIPDRLSLVSASIFSAGRAISGNAS